MNTMPNMIRSCSRCWGKHDEANCPATLNRPCACGDPDCPIPMPCMCGAADCTSGQGDHKIEPGE